MPPLLPPGVRPFSPASRRSSRRDASLLPLALALCACLTSAEPGRLSAAAPPSTFVFETVNPFGLAGVSSFAAPAFVDLDGDGDLDAAVGDGDGNVLFFANTGNATAPAFAAPVTNPFGLADVGENAAPTFADIDGDGDRDAFVGNLLGDVRFFRNVGTPTSPAFAAPASLGVDLPDGFFRATPTFVDIDGDGDLDAFVGEEGGNTFYFENTGTAASPVFATVAGSSFGLSNVHSDSAPAFADVDRDGDFDALIGSFFGPVDAPTQAFYFQNVGTATAPAFAPPTTLGVGAFEDAKPAFADIDGDGDLDAFAGNRDGQLNFFYSTAKGWYFTLTPCRVLDTRSATALASGVEVRVLMHGSCGIPTTARAVAINVTTTQSSGAGFLELFRAGPPAPNTSVLNFAAGQTRANNAIAELGRRAAQSGDCLDCRGQLALFPVLDDSGTVQVIVDVVGYFE